MFIRLKAHAEIKKNIRAHNSESSASDVEKSLEIDGTIRFSLRIQSFGSQIHARTHVRTRALTHARMRTQARHTDTHIHTYQHTHVRTPPPRASGQVWFLWWKVQHSYTTVVGRMLSTAIVATISIVAWPGQRRKTVTDPLTAATTRLVKTRTRAAHATGIAYCVIYDRYLSDHIFGWRDNPFW